MAQLKSDSQNNQKVDASGGKSAGWPSCLTYLPKKQVSRIMLTGAVNNLRKKITEQSQEMRHICPSGYSNRFRQENESV